MLCYVSTYYMNVNRTGFKGLVLNLFLGLNVAKDRTYEALRL